MEIALTIMFVHQNVDAVPNQAIPIGASVPNIFAKRVRATAEMTINVRAHLFVVKEGAVDTAMTGTTCPYVVAGAKLSTL